nr:TPA_inf: conotoxin precursor Cerm03 [Conus ebraeus]
MKLSVMFIVFLMLTMPMTLTCAGISRSAINGREDVALARAMAANMLALLQERLCPPMCTSCSNC